MNGWFLEPDKNEKNNNKKQNAKRWPTRNKVHICLKVSVRIFLSQQVALVWYSPPTSQILCYATPNMLRSGVSSVKLLVYPLRIWAVYGPLRNVQRRWNDPVQTASDLCRYSIMKLLVLCNEIKSFRHVTSDIYRILFASSVLSAPSI